MYVPDEWQVGACGHQMLDGQAHGRRLVIGVVLIRLAVGHVVDALDRPGKHLCHH